MSEDLCKRCGQCCYSEGEPCRHLVKRGEKYHCLIYPIRLGKETRKGHICVLRKDSLYDYPDCPYNTNKPYAI